MEKNGYHGDEATVGTKDMTERDYWINKLSGDWVKSAFPGGHGHRGQFESKELAFDLTEPLSHKLVNLANGSDYRLFMILLAGLNVMLYKYTDHNDIIVGAPIYRQEIEGEFINTILALRNRLDGDITFKELLIQVRQEVTQSVENQNYSLEAIIFKLGLRTDADDFPLFDVAILLDNIQVKGYLDDIRPSMIFSFNRSEEDNHIVIRGSLDYNADIFRESRARRIILQFQQLLKNAVAGIDTSLAELDILPDEEKRRLLSDFNRLDEGVGENRTLVEWFEDQVARTPDRIAAVGFQPHSPPVLTYEKLNREANTVAHLLQSNGASTGTIVAVLMEPSFRRLAALLGVLKSGSAYLPIDTEFPLERIIKVLDDVDAAFVLTEEALADRLSFTSLSNMAAGRIEPRRTPPREQITDFDALPFPDRTLVDYKKYHRYIGEAMIKHKVTLQTTRGCPYQCAYCHKLWPKRHVRRSADNIFREINQCYRAGIRRFALIDDIFNLDKEDSRRLFQKIIDHRLDLQFFFCNGLRADILTRDYIDLMVEAGTINIDVALESGSPRIQKLIRKNLNLDRFYENIQYIVQQYPQLILEMELMMGFPTETEEEALMTLDFLKQIHWVHFPDLHILKIFPTSDMARLAVELGVKEELIHRSTHLAYHELPETLPFSKSFAREFQGRFMNEYFLLKERFLKVLPVQANILSEDELVDKYDSYLPGDIDSFQDILDFVGISDREMGDIDLKPPGWMGAPDFNERIQEYFPSETKDPDAFRVLLLDISQLFSTRGERMIHNQNDEPMGLMYLLSYLNQKYGQRVAGEIYKSRVDFDSYTQLQDIVMRFKPQLIGIRTLSYYREFFHQVVAFIKGLGVSAPIVSGGPYATSDYKFILKDPHIDLVVLGEGELTFAELVESMMANGNKLPENRVLETIKGIAFLDKSERIRQAERLRKVIPLDRWAAQLSTFPSTNPPGINKSSDLLYLIATSGSTGTPKSVMIEHRNMANLLNFQYSHTGIDFSGRVLQFASIGFDVSAQEIFSTLCAGGTLYLIPAELKTDLIRLFDWIDREGLDILFLPPSFLKLVFSDPEHTRIFPKSVRHIVAAGEPLVVPPKLKEFLKKNRVYLHNHYGPTETHVVTSLTMDPAGDTAERPSIGRPISATGICILDGNLGIKPMGAAGELYIAGANVGRGYLNNPELTADKFVCRPLLNSQSHILYRTGDLARWRENGEIDFIGRSDFQVKIRGFRIELQEIERSILGIEEIKEAVVIDRKDAAGDLNLCAYFVSQSDLSVAGLREDLSRRLPEYMLPQYFIRLHRIPVTANGKVDRKNLPEPQARSDHSYIPPRDYVDEKFTRIWSEVLGIDQGRTGIDDNFFELGGNSLKATMMISKIHKTFNTRVTLGDIFDQPTIRCLADCIKGLAQETFTAINAAEKREYYAFSSAQKRLYIQQQVITDNVSYNMPSFFNMEGRLEVRRLTEVFEQLVVRHESFRTSFLVLDEEPVQRIHDPGYFQFEVETYDLTGEANGVEECARNFIRPFDLSKPPLLRTGLIRCGDQSHILMVDMHHIIADGTSLGIISREFMTLYGGDSLTPLAIQYKDFSQWQNRILASVEMKVKEDYWLNLFSGPVPILNLPTDYPRPEVRSYEGLDISVEIGRQLSADIQRLVLETETTLHVVLLAIFNILLAKYSGQQEIVVGTGIAGRHHADLEGIVGLFVNMLAMYNRPDKNKCFIEFLDEVKENALNAYANQEYQFEELVMKLDLQGNPARNPLFDVVFQTQNVVIPGIEIEGLVLKPYEQEFNASHFDLVIYILENNGAIGMRIVYAPALFKRSTVQNMAAHFVQIAEQVLENRDIVLEDITVATRFSGAAAKLSGQETQFQF